MAAVASSALRTRGGTCLWPIRVYSCSRSQAVAVGAPVSRTCSTVASGLHPERRVLAVARPRNSFDHSCVMRRRSPSSLLAKSIWCPSAGTSTSATSAPGTRPSPGHRRPILGLGPRVRDREPSARLDVSGADDVVVGVEHPVMRGRLHDAAAGFDRQQTMIGIGGPPSRRRDRGDLGQLSPSQISSSRAGAKAWTPRPFLIRGTRSGAVTTLTTPFCRITRGT